MAWVDFKAVRAAVSLEDVLFRYYRLAPERFTRVGHKLTGPCPVHNGDSQRAFHAELDRNLWHCFSQCAGGGNQLDLVAKKDDISIREAALRLTEFFGLGGGAPPTPPATPRGRAGPPVGAAAPKTSLFDGLDEAPDTSVTENPPLELHLPLRADHPHLVQDRGLTTETLAAFGVGYCTHGTMKGMIAIPVHRADGALVAYAGRRLKPEAIKTEGKYKFPKGFRKELELFHLHRARAVAKEQGLIIVEGFFTVMKLYQLGFHNAVALMGCSASDRQVELLIAATDQVILLLDPDEAGTRGAEKLQAALAGRVRLRRIRLSPDDDPESLDVRTARWLLNGVNALNLSEVTILRA